MYTSRVEEGVEGGKSMFGYVETDPSGRYGRYKELLGKGAMKKVYKAFDEVLGMEVAWNQVKLNDAFRSPEKLQRLYSEVHLLKTLDHDSIINFHTSWIDADRKTFNFITEMFTSGTLREYTKKYKRVSIRAIKNWARQILEGLTYLHQHDPPVIHRDLKCDNIFVNGHLGQVKIGDLGLAAILNSSPHAHSVIGTPEFMAPELYEEDYDELVDIYSFGMCVLEMLTSEYPYSECSNPAQIYKKVTTGKLPAAFYRIKDPEAQIFVGKCLENASKRLSARELLLDEFLASDEEGLLPCPRIPNRTLMPSLLAEPKKSINMTITGSMNTDDNDDEKDAINLKVKITGKHGSARNIYFPFDIVRDTPIDVATEMVKELEITDWEPKDIALMIEDEVLALVPTWKERGLPKIVNQHSFNYEEEDDHIDGIHHPFYFNSDESSSQASFLGFDSSCDQFPFDQGHCVTTASGWLQEDLIINDDTSSQASSNSYYYSSLNYCLVNENGFDTSTRHKEPFFLEKNHQYSRFCPEESSSSSTTSSYKQTCRDSVGAQTLYGSNEYKKLTKMRSLVDVRSQLLHKSLMDDLNKQRLFKTVGAVENIGYQKPDHDFSLKRDFNK